MVHRLSRVLCLPAALILASALTFAARVQPAGQGAESTFVFTLGGSPAPPGELWVYYYGSSDFERHLLSGIHGGRATVQITADLATTLRTHGLTRYIVAAHLAGIGWYRSPEFQDLRRDAMAGVEQLGAARRDNGAIHIDLAPPIRQSLRLLNEDGTPWSNATIELEPYVARVGRCEHHLGFDDLTDRTRGPQTTLITDHKGEAEWVAPLTPIFLLPHYFTVAPNKGRTVLFEERGQVLEAGTRHVVQQRWHEAAARAFRIQVRRPDGSPVPTAVLFGAFAARWCIPMWEQIGTTGADGSVRSSFPLEHLETLWLSEPTDDENWAYVDSIRRHLTEAEIITLDRTGSVTIVKPHP